VFALRKKEDGTDNCIDPSVTLDQAAVDALFKNEIARDRFLPLLSVKGYTPEQADPTTDEASNGDIDIVREGVESAVFEFRCANPNTLKAKLKAMACLDVTVFIIDTDGNIIGEANTAGKLCGRRVAKNSLNAKVLPRSFDGVNKIELSYNYDLASGSEKVDYIKAGDFTDTSLLDVEALNDVNIEFVGNPGLSGGTFKLFLDWGSIGDKIPVTGLTPTELIGYNQDTPGTVTLLTCTDTVLDGTYIYTHAAESAGEIFNIQGNGATIQGVYDTKRLASVSGTLTA
jgi:hypothetical protein